MKEILDKITSYNLFNYLLPGVIFAFMASEIGNANLIQSDLITGAFLYYFIGLIVSRFGSLLIEPFLRKITFVKFTDYKDFVSASKADAKLEILSEANNMYRTFISLLILLGLYKIEIYLENKCVFIKNNQSMLLILLLFLMFLFSYRKQTNYITKRVNINKSSN